MANRVDLRGDSRVAIVGWTADHYRHTNGRAALPALEAEAEDWSSLNYSIYPATGTLRFRLSRGMPQRVMIEIPFGSAHSMSFMVKTTLVPD